MSLPAPSARTVFRTCVVTAVREGEALMGQLVHVTQSALASEEITVRNVQQRNTLSEGLRQLKQHAPALIKGYPMALLEAFADGPAAAAPARPADATGFDFGELSLMDDAQVLAQVERSRAQQIAAHTTDAALAELNTLVSAAQGLPSVQPERNPLRPDNYIRALQQVFDQTDVPTSVRELWMRHMRELLAQQLVGTYQRSAQALRTQGIVPVGYAVLGLGGRGNGAGAAGGFLADPLGGVQASARAPLAGVAAPGADSGASLLDDDMQEALLTVGILRQMLDAQGVWAGAAALPAGAVVASRRAALHAGPPAAMAADAMEDIAALEQLVGALVATAEQGAPAAPPAPSAEAVHAAAADVVHRMVQTLSADTRLLAPVQRAVQQLEPALLQLVRVDPRFFDDAQHPARRLLDQVTERSLAFPSAEGPAFTRFMRLVNGAVRHLAGVALQDAQPFENVLKALESAWSVQAQEEERSRREAAAHAQALAAKHAARLARLAAEACALPGADAVPVDVLDFAMGPWVHVLAQLPEPDGAADNDPEGYRALLPVLLRLAQPGQDAAALERMAPLVPALLGTVRAGLESINHPEDRIAAVLERIADLHHAACEEIEGVRDDEDDAPDGDVESVFPPRAAFAMSFGMADDEAHARALLEEAESAAALTAAAAVPELEPLPVIEPLLERSPVLVAPPATPALLDLPVIDGSALDHGDPGFPIGAWVELSTHQRQVQTQLTWASPSGALFLFTAADGSTQSMTRRMRDKLVADGALRVLRVLPGTVR